MADVTVVGSGASGVHLACTLLERGHTVHMLDVGRRAPAHELPEASWADLKERLDDPAAYFLGRDFSSLVLPGSAGAYYSFPPNRQYVFEGVNAFAPRLDGIAPLFSFAQGGLAQTWTGGSYPLNDDELAAFPFGYDELGPHYDTVAARVGISGQEDDLAAFLPVHANLQEPLRLDAHGTLLLERYAQRRDALRQGLGAHIGRSRSAVLSQPLGDRPACDYLGRCLWGCPTDAFYTPEITLRQLLASERFSYTGGVYVRRFRYAQGRVTAAVVEPVDGGPEEDVPVDELALAAGALHSSRILLESILAETGEAPRLPGLMDNRQVLVPFVTPALLGRRYDPDSYQYNQLALGLEGADDPAHYVHCQITTLKTALLHPIVQGVPTDLRTALFLFGNLHGALGLINVNFHDTRRPECHLTLEPAGDGPPRLAVHYEPREGEPGRIRSTLGRVSRVLRKLGAFRAPGMTHVRPMGASVHYAGTVPMAEEDRPLTTTRDGRVRGFENLVLADGATFPFLPAKNLTFTLMANATRIATEAF